MTTPEGIAVVTLDDPPVVTGIGLLDPSPEPVPVAVAGTSPETGLGGTVVSVDVTPIVVDPGGGGNGGGSTGPVAHHHEQPVALSTWTVVHNLGFNPAGVVARDATGLIEPANVTYPDANICVLSWSVPVAGSVDLS